MTNLLRNLLLVGAAAGWATPAAASPDAGPASFDALLRQWDRAPSASLEARIDAVAGQRYATVSRLYWYRDLDAAKAAARAQQKPILALRMLGRLDEDLSCANSRLFRATLYANHQVSKAMRQHFVLYWSSERPVPRVTIDFGDGRKLERTTTGNSAHYVLADDGTVLDVLPGLYAPSVFLTELEKSRRLAGKVRGLAGAARQRAVEAHHRAELEAVSDAYATIAGTEFIGRRRRPLFESELGESAVMTAQLATMSKAQIEIPDLRAVGVDVAAIAEDDLALWAAIGQRAYVRPAPKNPRNLVLDDPSRALVARLHGGAAVGDGALDTVLERLEQTILADTAQNQFRLRQTIRDWIVRGGSLAFEELNAWIYAEVFKTPASDPWLGLHARTTFSGLPGDGVVVR